LTPRQTVTTFHLDRLPADGPFPTVSSYLSAHTGKKEFSKQVV